MDKPFPINVFRDVKPQEFNKFNKKEVTEDFVSENFKEIGWEIYRPFVDTGIDLIATKKVCPHGHTPWNKNTQRENICEICEENLILIKRFIQVKTRELKESENQDLYFGYTLKSKDFRTDPRHIFLLYSDFSIDFLIFSVYDYLKLFKEHEDAGKMHFANNSFRVGNNKINSIKYDKDSQKWYLSYGRGKAKKVYLEDFLNEIGIQRISNPCFDLRINAFIKAIAKLKCQLFYQFQYAKQSEETKEFHKEILEKVNLEIKNQKECKIKTIKKIKTLREKDKLNFCNNAKPPIIESVNKYWEQFNMKLNCGED